MKLIEHGVLLMDNISKELEINNMKNIYIIQCYVHLLKI